jgi:CheY-like chemotaxis protein
MSMSATSERPVGAPDGRGQLAPAAAVAPLRILVVDDDDMSRELLRAMVEKQGHTPVMAASGREAIAAFMREPPDLVLMDIVMPDLDGYEATEYMRELSGDAFLPVLFITALNDDASLRQCIASGGNDFLVKPFSEDILRAKIDAFAQLRRLFRTIKAQRDEMAGHNRWLKREYEVAEAVFTKVMHSRALDAPNIKYLVSPQAVFNGDIMLAAYRPSGELHVMVGDFTGHGLSAAIGAIPVADIFHGMTGKGFPIPEIVAEMNQRLTKALPRGLFLAAAMIELDAKSQKLSVWNGGGPDVVATRGDRGAIVHRFASKTFPFAVVETAQMDCSVETVEIESGSYVYMYTDGLLEATNAAGEMFGAARLEGCFGRERDSLPTYDRILNDFQEFREYQQQDDDITLIQIIADPAISSATTAVSGDLGPRPAASWRASFAFGIDALRGYDPLPMMLHVLLDAQRLHQHKQRLYMVLAELFLNAVDHGLLGLDSRVKAAPNGFAEYYREKERRMAERNSGSILVEFRHAALESGGCLTIRVEDGGKGFDFKERLASADKGTGSREGYHGRGILLVRSLCESLSYHNNGTCAEAVYVWSADAREQ